MIEFEEEGIKHVKMFVIITLAYIIFWGPLFMVTLINMSLDWKDAKSSVSHEVRILWNLNLKLEKCTEWSSWKLTICTWPLQLYRHEPRTGMFIYKRQMPANLSFSLSFWLSGITSCIVCSRHHQSSPLLTSAQTIEDNSAENNLLYLCNWFLR